MECFYRWNGENVQTGQRKCRISCHWDYWQIEYTLHGKHNHIGDDIELENSFWFLNAQAMNIINVEL